MENNKIDNLKQEINQLQEDLDKIYTGKEKAKDNILVLSHKLTTLHSQYKSLLGK